MILVNSKIVRGIIEKVASKALRTNVDETMELTIQEMNIECKDESTNVKISLELKFKTDRIPGILKKFGIL